MMLEIALKFKTHDIAHDGPNPQRAHYRQVVLPYPLRTA